MLTLVQFADFLPASSLDLLLKLVLAVGGTGLVLLILVGLGARERRVVKSGAEPGSGRRSPTRTWRMS
ncbi:MAG: hypothetical protein PVJ76_16740 [Gemmatimonadota bacterium]